jgi:hypothetical protein
MSNLIGVKRSSDVNQDLGTVEENDQNSGLPLQPAPGSAKLKLTSKSKGEKNKRNSSDSSGNLLPPKLTKNSVASVAGGRLVSESSNSNQKSVDVVTSGLVGSLPLVVGNPSKGVDGNEPDPSEDPSAALSQETGDGPPAVMVANRRERKNQRISRNKSEKMARQRQLAEETVRRNQNRQRRHASFAKP